MQRERERENNVSQLQMDIYIDIYLQFDHGPAIPINIILMIIQTRNVSIDCHGMQRKQQPIKVNVIEKRVEKDGPYVSTNFAFGKVNNKNDILAAFVAHDIYDESILSPYARLNSLELGPNIIHVTVCVYLLVCLYIYCFVSMI